MIYKPKYFKTQELVSREIYEQLGEMALNLFNPHVLRVLDQIRVAYNQPIIINDWHNGGQYSQSGLRALNCSIGATKSKHKEGIAFDLKSKNTDSLKSFLKQTSENFFISRIENFSHTPTWVHIEIVDYFVDETYYFNP